MNILVTYDVNTETKEGRRRLRKVATVCKNYGQRVQKSVFECSVDEMQLERLRSQVQKIIDEESDSLRIYRLHGDRNNCVECFGLNQYIEFSDPLIV